MKRAIVIVLGLVAAGCAAPLRLEYEPGQVTRAPNGGMVVAADPTAAEIGAAVLGEGGNAVDAAVAVAFAMGATLPQAGNPGGGGFAIVVLPGAEAAALDFRETAPAGARPAMFLGENGKPVRERSLWTPLAAGVPGTPAGLEALHRRFGSLPWERLVRPAVELAERGFPIPTGLSTALNEHRERFAKDPAARRIFVRDDRPWRAGDLLVQADLGRTLAAVRDRGAAAFYLGAFGQAIETKLAGGILTASDLASYRPVWRRPARFCHRGHELITMPLPSSGGVVLSQTLRILESASAEHHPPGSTGRLHLFAEAERRAFADRNALLGDPAGVPEGELQTLMSPAYATARALTIDPGRATPSAEVRPGVPLPESPETTNLVVVDGRGGAVVITYTLNATFGTHIVVPGTGVILNNEMDDFASKPGEANQFGLRQGERNAVVPGRRMLSSMSPTVALADGRVVLALGSPGGPRILTAVATVIAAHLGDGLPLDLAVLAPRIHHQHLPDAIFHEDADVVWPKGRDRPDLQLTSAKLRALEAMGHTLRARGSAIGRVTAIAVDPVTGERTAVADPRGYGRARPERIPADGTPRRRTPR